MRIAGIGINPFKKNNSISQQKNNFAPPFKGANLSRDTLTLSHKTNQIAFGAQDVIVYNGKKNLGDIKTNVPVYLTSCEAGDINSKKIVNLVNCNAQDIKSEKAVNLNNTTAGKISAESTSLHERSKVVSITAKNSVTLGKGSMVKDNIILKGQNSTVRILSNGRTEDTTEEEREPMMIGGKIIFPKNARNATVVLPEDTTTEEFDKFKSQIENWKVIKRQPTLSI